MLAKRVFETTIMRDHRDIDIRQFEPEEITEMLRKNDLRNEQMARIQTIWLRIYPDPNFRHDYGYPALSFDSSEKAYRAPECWGSIETYFIDFEGGSTLLYKRDLIIESSAFNVHQQIVQQVYDGRISTRVDLTWT